MSLPSFQEARERIEAVENDDLRMLFKTVYLFGLRIGEACGYKYESEVNAQPTGMLLWATPSAWQPDEDNDEDFILLKRLMMRNYGKELSDFDVLQMTEQAFVLSIVTEKRKGFNRQAAIPLNPDYEPWAEEVYRYISARQKHGPLMKLQQLTKELSQREGKPISIIKTLKTDKALDIIDKNEPIFPFYRQTIWPIATKVFDGLTYPIAQYKKRIGTDEEGKGVYQTVPAHQKPFTDHAIRHLRSTELKSFYRVKGEMLDKFMGWTKPRGGESSAMQDRYVLEPWKEAGYFPRLLRRRQ
jgi:hypothetical protein